MSYTINDLRGDLAATIKALQDKTNPMPVDRARAVADVAQTMINSAKVEVDMINAMGARALQPSGFIPPAGQRPALAHDGAPAAADGRLPPTGPTARP